MKSKQPKKKSLLNYTPEPRGLPNNRYGGYQSIQLRTYHQQLPWSSHGECCVYTDEEKRELERKIHAQGRV